MNENQEDEVVAQVNGPVELTDEDKAVANNMIASLLKFSRKMSPKTNRRYLGAHAKNDGYDAERKAEAIAKRARRNEKRLANSR